MTLEEWIDRLGYMNYNMPVMLCDEAIELRSMLLELQRLRQLKKNLDTVFGGTNND